MKYDAKPQYTIDFHRISWDIQGMEDSWISVLPMQWWFGLFHVGRGIKKNPNLMDQGALQQDTTTCCRDSNLAGELMP